MKVVIYVYILWLSVLLAGETGVPGGNHRPDPKSLTKAKYSEKTINNPKSLAKPEYPDQSIDLSQFTG